MEQNKQTFEKYKQLYLQRKKRITIFKKKLLRGNPHATSKHYNTELNELKQYLELQKSKKEEAKTKKETLKNLILVFIFLSPILAQDSGRYP